jgi:hypothetical protein
MFLALASASLAIPAEAGSNRNNARLLDTAALYLGDRSYSKGDSAKSMPVGSAVVEAGSGTD